MAQKRHINLLDSYIGASKPEFIELLKTYKETYSEFIEVEKKLKKLRENAENREKEIDFLTFQLNELDEAAVFDNEEEELKQELDVLNNALELKEGSYSSFWALYGDNQSIVEALGKIKYTISNLSELDKSLKEVESTLYDVFENLKDAANFLRDYSSNLNLNPIRLDEANERISLIQKLKRKYGADLTLARDEIAKKLNELTDGDNNIEVLEETYNTLFSEVNLMAAKISDYRKQDAKKLSGLVEQKLKTLELAEAKFSIEVDEAPKNELGKDRVEFLIATNKNQDLKPLNKVASGGEISRVMLALKTIFALSDKTPTVVFDEIDTGISGVTSASVANSICELAKTTQIISITHQPIIAAKADNFIWVAKAHNKQTDVKIDILDNKKRLEALAQLAGGDVSQQTLDFAKTLLK